MILRVLYLLLLLVLLAIPSMAQDIDTTEILRDVDSAAIDSSREDVDPPETGEYVMTKNPTTAVLFSFMPGGGQFYNEQYWKIPLFLGPAIYFAWRAIDLNGKFLDQAALADAVGPDDPSYPGLKQQREAYRDDRDLNLAYLLGIEILNMIDAYVGAHMFDFDVGDDISSRFYITPAQPGIGVIVQW